MGNERYDPFENDEEEDDECTIEGEDKMDNNNAMSNNFIIQDNSLAVEEKVILLLYQENDRYNMYVKLKMKRIDNAPEENEIFDKIRLQMDFLHDASVKERENIPLFGDAAIYQGKNNLLYAGAKVGKSYLSIEIAKHESIKKPLFIVLEDYSSTQKERYIKNLSNKALELISLADFEDKYDEEVDKRTQKAHFETGYELAAPAYHRMKTFNRQNYVDMGIIKQKSDKLDKIVVIEQIIAQALKEGVDFICIDPLYAILESGRELNRNHLVRLIKATSAQHVTLLLLHHTNKQREMALTQELRNTFDNIYRLDLIKRYEKSEGYTELKLTEEEARDNVPHVLYIKRTISQDKTVTHDVPKTEVFNPENKESKTNMKSMIKKIIENYDKKILSYQELIAALEKCTDKKNDEANIKKHLKDLKEQDKLINMADGKTWKSGIKILSPDC